MSKPAFVAGFSIISHAFHCRRTLLGTCGPVVPCIVSQLGGNFVFARVTHPPADNDTPQKMLRETVEAWEQAASSGKRIEEAYGVFLHPRFTRLLTFASLANRKRQFSRGNTR